jgi:uncharacterized protein (TIGR02147 family)
MIPIYDYFDYRKLLKDLFEEQKSQNRYFSYRVLAEIVGFTSAGFFTKILQGSVNISSQKALAFAKAFHMSRLETRYFELLVAFNQAKTHDERRYYFEQLIATRRNKIKSMTTEQYELFSEWYYVAIKEILEFYPFKGNFKQLGNMLQPAVHPNDAKKAIETLEALGMIKKKEGHYRVVQEIVSTGESWENVAVTNFQLNTADLAKDAIQNVPKEAREISTLTINVSQKSFDQIKEKLRNYRKDILEIAKKDSEKDRVYHLNLQLFPLSKPYNRTLGAGELIVKGKRGRRPLGMVKDSK